MLSSQAMAMAMANSVRQERTQGGARPRANDRRTPAFQLLDNTHVGVFLGINKALQVVRIFHLSTTQLASVSAIKRSTYSLYGLTKFPLFRSQKALTRGLPSIRTPSADLKRASSIAPRSN